MLRLELYDSKKVLSLTSNFLACARLLLALVTAPVMSKKEVLFHMQEKREEGLSTGIGADNAGFKLLMKMGYKGGGLGKDGNGQTAPLKPVMKSGRAGLGKEAEQRRRDDLKRTLLERMRGARAQQDERNRQDFRAAQSLQFRRRREAVDLARLQRLVETFDRGAGMPPSVMWPHEEEGGDALLSSLEESAGGGGDGGKEDSFRGASGGSDGGGGGTDGGGSSSSSGAASCGRPAQTAAAPASLSSAASAGLTVGTAVDGEAGAEKSEWASLEAGERLACCIGYLRSAYLHCTFCGITFENAEEMAGSCPGPGREEHDDCD
ncbi:unnamed protein product [Phaeothamnion confervicola]